MAKQVRAFVLSGGGARGALQAGALKALLEAGIQPDMLVGTSIGAANAACLALYGTNRLGLAALEAAWRDAGEADLLPANYLWLTVRALLRRNSTQAEQRMRAFFEAHGLTPKLRFGDITGVRLLMVAADLNSGCPVIYGTDPEQTVLEGLLASAALPPWIRPLRADGRSLIDGGLVSNLPVEPAIAQGATEIIALDLADARSLPAETPGFGPFFIRLLLTTQQRHTDLELQLAAARGVPVRRIELRADPPGMIWDFSGSERLMEAGYQITRAAVAGWETPKRSRRFAAGDWLSRSRFSRWRRAA